MTEFVDEQWEAGVKAHIEKWGTSVAGVERWERVEKQRREVAEDPEVARNIERSGWASVVEIVNDWANVRSDDILGGELATRTEPSDVEAIITGCLFAPPLQSYNPRAVLLAHGFRPELLSCSVLRLLASKAVRAERHENALTAAHVALIGRERLCPIPEGWGRFLACLLTIGYELRVFARHYLRLLFEHYCRRKGLGTAEALHSKLGDDRIDIDKSLDDGIRSLMELRPNLQERKASGVNELAPAVLAEIKAPLVGADVVVGDRLLDETLNGLRAGEVLVVGARPGQGKTTLGLHAALENAAKGLQVVFVSAEMTSSELTERCLSRLSGVDSNRIRSRSLSPDDKSALEKATTELRTLRLSFIEAFGMDIGAVEAQIETISSQEPPKLVIVDYLGLIEGPGKSIYERVTNVSRALKVMAGRMGVSVMALAQLNRNTGEDQRPTLADLRDSGAIEQDADRVLFPWRDKEEPDCMTLSLGKNRHGALATSRLRWDKPCFRLLPFGVAMDVQL